MLYSIFTTLFLYKNTNFTMKKSLNLLNEYFLQVSRGLHQDSFTLKKIIIWVVTWSTYNFIIKKPYCKNLFDFKTSSYYKFIFLLYMYFVRCYSLSFSKFIILSLSGGIVALVFSYTSYDICRSFFCRCVLLFLG